MKIFMDCWGEGFNCAQCANNLSILFTKGHSKSFEAQTFQIIILKDKVKIIHSKKQFPNKNIRET